MTTDQSKRDERRKLSELDYKAMRYAVLVQNRTIREVANSYSCSTKYVKRLISQTSLAVQTTILCSGCGFTFSSDDIQQHYAVWTSGGTHELSCGEMLVVR